MANGNDWITLHRVKFPLSHAARDVAFTPPETARFWRFCPSSPISENGLPTFVSDVWGGFAVYGSRSDAEAVLADPETWIPSVAGAVEAWHALAVPVSHRGKVNWRGAVEDGTALIPAATDPGGPIVVLTTAGFDSRAPSELPRISDFVANVVRVQRYYDTLEGNLRNDVFNGGYDGRDGVTCSLWKDDASMMEAAYHPGFHRSQLDRYRKETTADRTSFTRARILASRGDWNGADPYAP